MSVESSTTIDLPCPSCGADTFELRVLADEGLATARCVGCAKDFLLLDSEDYWFDAIQTTYPRVRRCTCGTTAFRLKCDYFLRDDGDVKSVNLWSSCSSCGKTKRQMELDLDYTGTEELISRPLRFCKTPKLRYDLKDISLYVTKSDMTSIIGYLDKVHGCSFACWLWGNGRCVVRTLCAHEVQEAFLSDQCFHVHASLLPLTESELQAGSAKQEKSFWKRKEVIRISSPTHITLDLKGLLYYIQYSNEYVEDDTVVPKRENFRAVSESLLRWLGANFVSWRGRHCFDNPSEHLRLFGDRFAKSRTSEHSKLPNTLPEALRATEPLMPPDDPSPVLDK